MPAIEIRTPGTWLELQDLLFGEPFKGYENPYHSGLIHRGMSRAEYTPMSSIERQGLFHAETHLLRNFQKYAREVGVPTERKWEWLAIGQHHGLPTRFLDWTYSPLVALHFATENGDIEHDSAVWSLDYVRAHDRLPKEVKCALVDDATAFTTQMLDASGVDIAPDTGSDPRSAYLIVLEPPSLDDRIVNQYAGLSALSSTSVSTEAWLETFDEPIAVKIVIPAALKQEVREKLDKSNINERVIYPGLDGLSKWLGRYYSTPKRTWI